MDLKRGSLARTAGLGGPFLCGGRSGFAGRGPCCSSSRFSFDRERLGQADERLCDHLIDGLHGDDLDLSLGGLGHVLKIAPVDVGDQDLRAARTDGGEELFLVPLRGSRGGTE